MVVWGGRVVSVRLAGSDCSGGAECRTKHLHINRLLCDDLVGVMEHVEGKRCRHKVEKEWARDTGMGEVCAGVVTPALDLLPDQKPFPWKKGQQGADTITATARTARTTAERIAAINSLTDWLQFAVERGQRGRQSRGRHRCGVLVTGRTPDRCQKNTLYALGQFSSRLAFQPVHLIQSAQALEGRWKTD